MLSSKIIDIFFQKTFIQPSKSYFQKKKEKKKEKKEMGEILQDKGEASANCSYILKNNRQQKRNCC